MSISDADYKLLWGRAAGLCSNPACRADLTVLVSGGDAYNIGEMAHIIARRPTGARGRPKGGSDSYDNLILLCPTCHRHIDKASPGQYPEELLRRWKSEHEAEIRNRGATERFSTLEELKRTVGRILSENHVAWKSVGPKSETALTDPGSNLYSVWFHRKLDTIIPNNRRIINVVEANRRLIDGGDWEAFLAFKTHALAFESHQYERLDSYPQFPEAFAKRFSA